MLFHKTIQIITFFKEFEFISLAPNIMNFQHYVISIQIFNSMSILKNLSPFHLDYYNVEKKKI